ncbi:MAG: C45 family peptidase [Muribaculaceae bacterium]|nr:C45 family peptidase [Muribaculaceae bacterium]
MKKFLLILSLLLSVQASIACTSAIISGKITKNGRPLIWKHRDTGAEQNFIARVEPKDGKHGFVALYNGGDSLLESAWMGMNDAGFAIMNTASYNLMPDTAKFVDQEGVVMRHALEKCRTLNDFEVLLSTLPKPLGVQANFGVLDAEGHGAYYETDDYNFKKFALDDVAEGFIIRTNYSVSGKEDGGYGYIRENNARYWIEPHATAQDIIPELFTEGISRSFYHSLIGRDFMKSGDRWAVDQDFVPRKSSSASIVIEGMLPGETPEDMTMWSVVGYPPVSHVKAVTINDVPAELQPTLPGYLSPYCQETIERKNEVFSIKRGSGSHYLDMFKIKEYEPKQLGLSAENYKIRRAEQNRKRLK